MTFTQWQASGYSTCDLAAINELRAQDVTGPGRVYDGKLYLEQCGPISYCLTIGNDSSVGGLAEQERKLYDWAVSQGYFS